MFVLFCSWWVLTVSRKKLTQPRWQRHGCACIHCKPFMKQPFIKQIALLNRSPLVPNNFIQLAYSMVYQTGSVIKQITFGPNACLISSLQCTVNVIRPKFFTKSQPCRMVKSMRSLLAREKTLNITPKKSGGGVSLGWFRLQRAAVTCSFWSSLADLSDSKPC